MLLFEYVHGIIIVCALPNEVGGFRDKAKVDSGGFRWIQVDSDIFIAEIGTLPLDFFMKEGWIQRNHLNSL